MSGQIMDAYQRTNVKKRLHIPVFDLITVRRLEAKIAPKT